MAAGAAEMADLTEGAIRGDPPRATRSFAEREAPYVALDDDALRERLAIEALRLHSAVKCLGTTGMVTFAGRSLDARDLARHGRSETVLHRFDLAGDDDDGRDLLAQPDLTEHALVVLNTMLPDAPECVARRARVLGEASQRLAFAAPGQPDVVLCVGSDGARLELAEPATTPVASADAATRLLALWGRRSRSPIRWGDDEEAAAGLARFLGIEHCRVGFPPE
jgi:hypothetical protein